MITPIKRSSATNLRHTQSLYTIRQGQLGTVRPPELLLHAVWVLQGFSTHDCDHYTACSYAIAELSFVEDTAKVGAVVKNLETQALAELGDPPCKLLGEIVVRAFAANLRPLFNEGSLKIWIVLSLKDMDGFCCSKLLSNTAIHFFVKQHNPNVQRTIIQ